MTSLRGSLKKLVERILGSGPALAAARIRLRGERLILCYHNVVEADQTPLNGDSSVHLPLRSFLAQLDMIRALSLPVVPLDAPAVPGTGPRVTITFDDAYAGAIQLATSELARRGMAATVFVAPGLLGSDAAWWDRLADHDRGAIPPAIREVALQALAGDSETILGESSRRGWRVNSAAPFHRIATERELDAAVSRHPLLALGAHSWSHPNLGALSGARLADELVRPLAWLTARWPDRVVPWLAYPYGIATLATQRAVHKAGYHGALMVSGGWTGSRDLQHALPRSNVTPGLSVGGFRSRLAGFA